MTTPGRLLMAREDSLYMARLAEETERYEDLVSSTGTAPETSEQTVYGLLMLVLNTLTTYSG